MPEKPQRRKESGTNTFLSLKFLLPLLIVHLAIALPLAYVLNIWVDEGSSLYTTQNGLFRAFREALANELQAPLYFWLLGIWRSVDSSIFFARLFSLWCSLLAIKAAYDAARRYLPEYSRKVAVIIFALHPLLFWASTEIRGYSLVILFSTLLLRFFYDAYLTEKPKLKDRIFFIVIAAAALYTNYFLGFILVGNFCALLALRRFRQAAIYLGHMAVVALLFSPLIFAASGQFEARSEMGDRTLFEGLRTVWQHLQTFLLPVNIFSEEANTAALLRLWIFRFGAAGIFLCLLIRKFKGVSSNTLALGIICVVPALFFLAVVSLLGSGYVNIRHASLLLSPAVLFFSALLFDLFGKKGLLVWAALLVFFIPFSTWQEFAGLVKRGDWEKVSAYVQSHEKPGQTIMLFKPYDSLAFSVYYKGTDPILPREGFFLWARQNNFNFTDRLPEQTVSLISQVPAEGEEVWVLTGEICDNPKTMESCRALEEFFNSNYTMIDSQNFYLEKVRLYRKK
jgi:hypothetical protein